MPDVIHPPQRPASTIAAAEHRGVTPQTIRAWARRGYIRSWRAGPLGNLVFDLDDIDAMVQPVTVAGDK